MFTSATQPSVPPPAARKQFWTRTKVGLVGAVAGLLVGVGLGGNDAGDDQPTRSLMSTSEAKTQADAAVASATEQLESELARSQADAAKARSDLATAVAGASTAQQAAVDRAVKKAVAQARKEERAKAAKAVEEAKASATAGQTHSFAGSSGSLDPRFDTCTEAIGHGYGPYVEGADPEYDWYQDRDGDGRVCE